MTFYKKVEGKMNNTVKALIFKFVMTFVVSYISRSNSKKPYKLDFKLCHNSNSLKLHGGRPFDIA